MIDQSQSVAIDEFQRNSGEIDMLIGFLVMNGACIGNIYSNILFINL